MNNQDPNQHPGVGQPIQNGAGNGRCNGRGANNPAPPLYAQAPGLDPGAIAQLAQALQIMQVNNRGNGRPKTIQCKGFKMGESWQAYKQYFRENVRAQCSYRHDQINEVACIHVGSKLEPGPTLAA